MEIFVCHSQLLYMVLTIVYGTALPWEFVSKPWISIGVDFEKMLLSHYNEFCFDGGRCCAASSGKVNLRWWPVYNGVRVPLKVHCKVLSKNNPTTCFPGGCTWGMSCRFLHPGHNDKGIKSNMEGCQLLISNLLNPCYSSKETEFKMNFRIHKSRSSGLGLLF